MTRIATYGSHLSLLSRMLDTQRSVHDAQAQVSTEKKSQDYAGLAASSFRLVALENERSLSERFVETNQTAMTKLNVMETSLKAVDKVIRTFRSDLQAFQAVGPSDPGNLTQMQNRAWDALQQLQSYLDVKVEGDYVFGGGKTDTMPVQIPWGSLAELQADYAIDSSGTAAAAFPTTRAGHLAATYNGGAAGTGYYYEGDTLELEHRLDDIRSITLGINAADPAIEKAMRAMFMMAQGEMDQQETVAPNLIGQSITLLNDAIIHDAGNTAEKTNDLTGMLYNVGANKSAINQAINEHKEFVDTTEKRIIELENIDMLEAVTLLNDQLKALEVSYTAFGRIRQLSLAQYL
jgi:flagellin-like hook-associated protein FlgL